MHPPSPDTPLPYYRLQDYSDSPPAPVPAPAPDTGYSYRPSPSPSPSPPAPDTGSSYRPSPSPSQSPPAPDTGSSYRPSPSPSQSPPAPDTGSSYRPSPSPPAPHPDGPYWLPPRLPRSPHVPHRSISTVVIAGPVIGLVLMIAGLVSAGLFIRRRNRARERENPSAPPQPQGKVEVSSPVSRTTSGLVLGPQTFTYQELKLATDGFSRSNFLGEGGFGIVHKGVHPSMNNKSVAIKQLKSTMEEAKRDFQSEAVIISRIHHKHLVSLAGYCVDEVHKKVMLVYEYVPNRTLAHHLHGEGTTHVDWETRMKIAVGSAQGLKYLHEDCHPPIIHRDIKADNILLDDNFEPKVADFGLARLLLDACIMTRVMGTKGYIAPEFAMSGNYSEKSDIFSFGIVLLELITGRQPVNDPEKYPQGSLYEWATTLLSEALRNRNFEELADARLRGKYDPAEMFRMVSCAANCVRHSAERRPRMSEVGKALEGVISLDNDLTEDPAALHQREAYAETLRRMVAGTRSTPVPSDQFHPLED